MLNSVRPKWQLLRLAQTAEARPPFSWFSIGSRRVKRDSQLLKQKVYLCPPTCMKPVGPAYRILVMSKGFADSAEIVRTFTHGFGSHVMQYNADHPCRALVVLRILDRIRAGHIDAVLLMAPASTWSRKRHEDKEGSRPLRSRPHPFDIPSNSKPLSDIVRISNRSVEVATWFAQKASQCQVHRVALVFVFPDDNGGHMHSGPSSVWSVREVRAVEHHNDAQRYAVHLCRFCAAANRHTIRRPVGVLTNLGVFDILGSKGWPTFRMLGDNIVHTRNLRTACRCNVTDSWSHKTNVKKTLFWRASFVTVDVDSWKI